MALHNSMTGTNAHKAYAWSYANASARTGASGFVASDIGDLAYQEDTDTLWILTATTPTWQQVDYLGMSDMYSANSILAADTADTPAALVVAEQRLVGRITGGTIAALTATQVRTLINVEDGADVTDATNVAAAGAVMEADFNANTILAADTDNTPAALVVAEQRLVGRITAGNIADLTATQVRTLLNVEDGATADQTANEILTALLTVDGTGSLLDADKLDGLDDTDFVKVATAQTITVGHTVNPGSAGNAFTLGANAVNILKTATDSYLIVGAGTTANDGACIIYYGSTHSSYPGRYFFRMGGADNIGAIGYQYRSSSATTNIAMMDYRANFSLGENIMPSTGTNSVSIKSGTAPSTLTDNAQIYSADITAGNCAIHCQTEGGAVVKLFQGAAVADATDAATTMARLNDLLARMRANGLIAT